MNQHKMKRNKNNMIHGYDDEEDEVQEEEVDGWEGSVFFQERNNFMRNHSLITDTIV